jgi:H3 lysine-79-specific histone-lysine N-methyltransferase
VEDFEDTVHDFNKLIKPLLQDGTIHRELVRKTHLPLPLVKRILEQTYSRTVSPRVDNLKKYKNGSDNVYGELLPDFVSEILQRTRLNHEQVFVDLGSGVGNVVLQAALEIGAESWGIEMMDNPCDLAELQAKEFPARAKLWGLNVGKVHLLRGDFTANTRIGEVLKRADVVLVNNQAFTAGLNETLLSMFLDLKEGCQVVSLKPFVPIGHKISMRNVDSPVNMFVQREAEYFSNRVSWTDRSGTYYYATKDMRPLRAFRSRM